MSVNEKMKAIADKIRERLKTDKKYDLDGIAQGIDEVYSQGSAAGYLYGESEAEYAANQEKTSLSKSLSEALTSGSENTNNLNTNIELAKSDITAIKDLIEDNGVEVPVGTSSSTYGAKLNEIFSDRYMSGLRDGETAFYENVVIPARDKLSYRTRAETGMGMGMLEKYVDGAISDFDNIEAAIEAQGVDVDDNSTSVMANLVTAACDKRYDEGKTDGIEQGRKSQYDEFWDEAQNYGNLATYDYFFAGGGWTKNNAKPKYKIRPTSAYAMFDRSSVSPNPITTLEDLGVEVDFSQCVSMIGCFQNSNFKYISKITCKPDSWANFGGCFNSCNQLEKIGEFKVSRYSINNSSANGISFPLCTKLTDITMVGEIGTYFNAGVCPLNKASIISIIEHLSTSVGYKLTLKKTAVETAFPYIFAATFSSEAPILDTIGTESFDYTIWAMGIGDYAEIGEYIYISFADTNVVIQKTGDSVQEATGINEGEWLLVTYGDEIKDEWGDLVSSKPNWTISLV